MGNGSTGSGPIDRDQTVGGNKPFKDLATGLASRGIAVLRYDKRTMIYRAKVATLKDLTVRKEVMIPGVPASYWLDLRGFDAPSEASRVKTQMPILHGERDYQVTAEEFGRWESRDRFSA
jgi:hypothetical protein